MRTDIPARARSQVTAATLPSGYGPADLQSAYNLATAAASLGAGATVAIVDAYDQPNALSDVNVYRAEFGIPTFSTSTGCASNGACFEKVSQSGSTSQLPSGNSGWGLEISLDIEMVSAICPKCDILLVEANSNSFSDLATAVDWAASNAGVVAISNSYGGSEFSSETSEDAYYHHPGIAVTASSGDNGYGVEYPAASPYVVGVGGTTLTGSQTSGWSETAWSGAGSGCSSYEPQQSWQTNLLTAQGKTGCSRRAVADVSAVADPSTGVAVYDDYGSYSGWYVVGGTSVASPIIASTFALAGNPGTNPGSDLYAHPSALNDVTSGSNARRCSPAFLCKAGSGYDGPTGLGTPDGTAAFAAPGGNTVTVNNPGNQAGTVGTAVNLQISASDSASGQTFTWSASGLPSGLSINTSTGLITGTPTTAATYNVTVTATDTTRASGSTSFTWTVNGNTVTVTTTSLPNGVRNKPYSATLSASGGSGSYSWSITSGSLPNGLSLNGSTGTISGTPTNPGSSTFTVSVTDGSSTAQATFSIKISPH